MERYLSIEKQLKYKENRLKDHPIIHPLPGDSLRFKIGDKVTILEFRFLVIIFGFICGAIPLRNFCLDGANGSDRFVIRGHLVEVSEFKHDKMRTCR